MKFMKVTLVAALLLAAKQAGAFFDISAFGGYTKLSMDNANASLDQFQDSYSFVPTDELTHISSGYYVGADASFSVFPFIKVGPRLEYIGGAQGKLHLSDGSETADLYFEPTLLMYEVGVSSDFSLPLTGLSIQGGLWGGYGMVGGQLRSHDNTLEDEHSDLSGGGFVGEVGAQVRYKIIPLISLGLDLGYRMANISQVNSSTSTTFFGPSGTMKDGNGNDIAFDFSGFNIGGNVSFNF